MKNYRPICWHCGRQLQYVQGKAVFAEDVDCIGNRHRLHKICYEEGGYIRGKPDLSRFHETDWQLPEERDA